jgi:amino acid transporter
MNWKNSDLSEDAQILLETLKERKKEKESKHKTLKLANILLVVFILFFCFFIYRFTLLPSNNDALKLLELFLNNEVNILLIIIILSVKLWASNASKESIEAKGKYEDLREEAVEYFDTTWLKSDISKIRDQVSKDMKDNHGINITHKS